jgi:hypothetical protein
MICLNKKSIPERSKDKKVGFRDKSRFIPDQLKHISAVY